jgi:putative chitinase
MSHPEWLAKQPGCQKASMFFWLTRGLNELADRDNGEAVTRRINGGINGLAQRLYYLRKAKGVFFI